MRADAASCRAIVAILGVSLVSLPVYAQATDAVDVNAPAQTLAQALRDFSRQTGIEIIVSPQIVAGRRSEAVVGHLAPMEALERMLGGAGLRARRDGDAIIVFSATHVPDASDGHGTGDIYGDVVRVLGYRESLAESLDIKRHANQVVDVITAEETGQFPDQNVAESIQRVTGVSMTRVNGEGDKITIRGLDPDLTRVEINGRSTFLTQDTVQPRVGTSLSIFASDQFSRIEVVKSPTASDIEGGVGGTVRLITPRPLEIGERSWRLDVEGRGSSRSQRIDQRVSGMVSDTFLDDRVGMLIAASFDDRTRRVDQMRSLEGWAVIDPDTDLPESAEFLRGHVYATHLDQQLRIGEQPRMNLNLTAQFMAGDGLEFETNINYAVERRDEKISRIAINPDAPEMSAQIVSGVVNPATGTIVSLIADDARFTINNRGLRRDISALGWTFSPTWRTGAWTVSGRIDQSVGEELGHDRRVRHRSVRTLGYDARGDARAPSLKFPGFDLRNLSGFSIDRNEMGYRLIRTDETAARADVTRSLSGVLSATSAGARVSRLEVVRQEGLANVQTDMTLADASAPFPLDDFLGDAGDVDFLRMWPYADARRFVDRYGPEEAAAKAALDPTLGYALQQESAAAYVQADFNYESASARYRGNAGVRAVSVSSTGRAAMKVVADRGGEVIPLVTRNAYKEWLPSFNLAVEPDFASDVVFRLSAARVMTRPRPAELDPSTRVDLDELIVSRGNPALKPFVANQFDLGAELYFGSDGEGQAALAVFGKNIENFAEPVSMLEPIVLNGGEAGTAMVSTYANGGSGKVAGIEASVQSPFSFLPAPFDRFGGVLNYTHLDSRRTLADGSHTDIPGNSPNTLNATLFYEHNGLSARASYNYRDTYLHEEFGPSGYRVFVEGDGRIDLALRYRMSSGLSLSLDIANLTEEGRYAYADKPDRVYLNQIEGRIVTAGLSYGFR